MIEPADVANGLGRPTPTTPATITQWSMWIGDARMLVRNRMLSSRGTADLDQLDQETLDYVVRQAVTAMVKRPDDATQVEIQVDDGRISKRYESSKGEVTITDAWWELLGLGDSGAGAAFSIRPYGQPDVTRC